jgi:hypothetical protein
VLPRPERVLTWVRWACEDWLRMTLEPRDKLDATAIPETMVAGSNVVVNGPEDEPLDWDAVDWRRVEEDVRRLRQRIFAASRAGDLAKVRSLQKLMLRSRSNALLAVRRVTEINAGRKTAGVDRQLVVTAQQKADLAGWAQHHAAPWSPLPVKRVYVPKRNGHRRGLGIPVIADRALQALTVNALEPSGRPGSSPRAMGFGRAGAATTRSWRSTRRRAAPTRNGCGRSTPIWRRHSTGSVMSTSAGRWAPSLVGDWCGSG